MSVTVTMPQMGESVVEGTLEHWLVQEGEKVEKDQTICEITTDKVDAEVPAPEAGVVTRLLVSEGDVVEVGAELAEIDPDAEATVSGGAKSGSATPTTDRPAMAPTGDSSVRATPLARRIAEDKGINLGTTEGSGAGGLVTKADLSGTPVRATAPGKKSATSPAVSAPPGSVLEFLAKMKVPTHRVREDERVVPFSSIRRRIAEHMVVSKIVSPHVGTVAELDLFKLVQLRDGLKNSFKAERGFSLTFLPFIVQATVRALKDYPVLNATVVGDTLVERNGIHVGVAVETERGLLVPVIRDADRLSLVGIAERIEELAQSARKKTIGADDLQGGTFTVSNPGRQGNLYGFAVINQPQVGILRMGEIRKTPVVVEHDGADTIAIRPMMHLALSYDHRVVDGVTGNGFLFAVGRYLEAAEFEV
ncbi:MAG: 2-oxo acid dehydrogenase subunit E2 [bacterium]|nr:2-oxo acid dehydrogenase subunit E2 [bacterium]